MNFFNSVTIRTRYLPETSTTWGRVQAESSTGQTVTFPRDFSLSLKEFHKQVAEALALQIATRAGKRVGSLTEFTEVGRHTGGYTFRVRL